MIDLSAASFAVQEDAAAVEAFAHALEWRPSVFSLHDVERIKKEIEAVTGAHPPFLGSTGYYSGVNIKRLDEEKKAVLSFGPVGGDYMLILHTNTLDELRGALADG